MSPPSRFHRIVPAVLGAAMLAVLIAAALSPNTGAVPAQSNCTYGQCPSSTTPFPWWIVALVVVIVVAAIIGLLLVMRGRRKKPPAQPPLTAWGGTGAGGAAGGAAAAGGPSPPAGPGTSPAYLETPEDVSSAPPVVAPTPAVGAAAGAATAGAAAGAAGAEAEPDIDSLMAELDKISGEILKRAPKKGSESQTPSPDDEE